MNKRPAMEKALDAIAHTHAKIIVSHKEDLSVENMLETLKKAVSADKELVTVENFNLALDEFKASLLDGKAPVPKPKTVKKEEEAAEDDAEAAARRRPSACAAPPPDIRKQEPVLEKEEEEEAPAETPAPAAPAEPEAAAQRPHVELTLVSPLESTVAGTPAATPAENKDTGFVKGDLVEVFSASSAKWHDDGVVLQVLEVADVQDGLSLPISSVKIQYQNDHRLKWIPPCHLGRCLRKSERPRPPKALTGELLKETHNWVAEWHVRYFQLKRGWLQWWVNREDAVEGIKPNGALDLTGLAVGSAGTVFSMRTENSKGVVYNFDARNVDDVSTWMQGLKEHAMYIDKMKTLMKSRNAADYA